MKESNPVYKDQPMIKKLLYGTLGIIAVALGTIGIFVPGLPTTPFILLASWLFYRSSERLHNWLNASFLGRYIKRYKSGNGVSWKTKILTICCMLTMSSISIFFLIPSMHVRIVVGGFCMIGVMSIIVFVPNQKSDS